MGAPLGIIAGEGALPKLVAERAKADGREPLIVLFDGFDPDWADGFSVVKTSFEKPGKMFRAFAERNCQEVVFAGGMTRPKLNPLRFDTMLLKHAPKLLPALKGGDDATLRVIRSIFEAEGIRVLAAHDILPDVLCGAGILGQHQPSEQDKADAQRAFEIVSALGQCDTGQACVVANGVCLGLESIQGTDAMLEFVTKTRAPYADNGTGVLYKGQKPQQDAKLDVPTIGPDTVKNALAARLAGVVIQAEKVMILDRAKTIEYADDLGLFLWARP